MLSGLTTRGRAFVAAGLTAVVCAIILGQDSLTRVGALVAVLPPLSALLIGRGRYRLALVRTVSPRLVTAGQSAQVRLTISNSGRASGGSLLLEEQLPYALGTRPRFVLEGLHDGWKRHITYRVRSELRGRFEIGPMAVRVSDPFGLVEVARTFQTSTPLIVTPRTVALPPIRLGGAWTGSGDNRPRAFASGSAEDVTVREYRRGDDLRRVHWRSSARVGELMVRREEQPWQSRATVFLDNRIRAHRGQGAASSFESAVTAAASVAVHLSQRGFTVRLVTATGEDPGAAWHFRKSELNTGPLLESLAVVEQTSAAHVDSGWLGEGGTGGLLVAVFGALDRQDQPVVRRMLHHSAAALALAVDVERWAGGPGREQGSLATALGRQGWRAADLAPGDRLDSVWQELGRSGARSTGTDLVSASPR